MAKVKLTFKETLAAMGLCKGSFLKYKTEYTLNTGDAEAVRQVCEKRLMKFNMNGSCFVENNQKHIHFIDNSGKVDYFGKAIVRSEIFLWFTLDANGHVKVTHEEISYLSHNARYSVEKGFLKQDMLKAFGEI